MVVYHASRHRGLRRLVPRPSTHGQPWVYACKDRVMAALFLSGAGGDLTCAVGREEETGLPYVCERFSGAFEHRYAGAQGSIYELRAEPFLEGKTSWEEEVVSPTAVSPLDEIEIDDAATYIRGLQDEGRMPIYLYPSRPRGIPDDDEDLVMQGIVERIRQGLAAGRYPGGLPRQDGQ